jgi:ribosomal protein S7
LLARSKEELASSQAHDAAKQTLATTHPTQDALAEAQSSLDADQLQQQSLALERGAAQAAHATREAAASESLAQELADAERLAASGGLGAAAKKRMLEELKASLQNGTWALNCLVISLCFPLARSL